MNTLKTTTLVALSLIIGLSACKKTETTNLKMSFSGLEPLGADYEYEGWLIVDGTPVSVGIFDIDASGNPTISDFDVEDIEIDKTTAYVLTIEPSPDSDSGPSSVHIIAGDLNNNIATLTVDHGSALGTNFNASTGKYILATPTDGMMNNENSGVWWLDNSSGSPEVGLDLPTLPAGWKYEGWAVINGTPVSTGTFTSVTGIDDFDGYSSTQAGPPFPGEDFLINAPSGQTFPTNLAGATVVISVEPSPDNSTAPFTLKPLVASVSATATDHTVYNMTNNAANTNPTGSITLSTK